MSVESILAFSFAMFVLAVTPGPGIFAVVAHSLSSDFRSSLPVIVGIVLGDILFFLLAVFGLSTLVHVLKDLFFTIRIAGGIYLVCLGWKMWRADPFRFDLKRVQKRNGWEGFFRGLLITLGNPKVILFYMGFLPTFVDLSNLKLNDIVVLACVISAILMAVMGFYSYSAYSARRLFNSRRACQNINRCAGCMMIGTGIIIASR
jgi:threonine/homoserine/homoserine lactone efflux protein